MARRPLLDPINVVTGTVVNRPSKVCKTPYVCDLRLEDGRVCLAHTPSLGCNGMVDAGATVIASKQTTGKCEYKVIGSLQEEDSKTYIVGVDPGIAERMAGVALSTGLVDGIAARILNTQSTLNECRFDYSGVTAENEPFICEVKNTSIAVYENLPPKQVKKMSFADRAFDTKVAIFPSGYKPKGQTHSERALKHAIELTRVRTMSVQRAIRCVLLYVIQRTDIQRFQVTVGDTPYLDAVAKARESGVELKTLVVDWVMLEDGVVQPFAVFDKQLPVILPGYE